ncbi:MAG: DUF4293 domain-containing protein [Bacteroidales bacterium]
MFQRIQTLFLLLVPVVIIVMFFIPLASFESVDGSFALYLRGFVFPEGMEGTVSSTWLIMPALGVLLGIMAIVVSMMYKNRVIQLKANRFLLLINVLFIASIFYITDKVTAGSSIIRHAYNMGAYLSLLPAILIYLSNGRIRRDEQKVRAADRLR